MITGGNGGNEGYKEKQRWMESKVYTRKSFKGLKMDKTNSKAIQEVQTLPPGGNPSQQPTSEDSSSWNRPLSMHVVNRESAAGNGGGKIGFLRQESRITINLSTRSKHEMRELRRKLENELDSVRSLVKKIESKDGFKNRPSTVGNVGGLKRVHSEVGSVGLPRESRPLHQLNVSVLENSQSFSDTMEKEKRTPKANQLYRNSEFLLAKDKMPPAESNKKSKSSGKKGGGAELGNGFGLGKFSNQAFKSCKALLERLMKHKHGWVFNNPVDPLSLGLHDYFDIIKHPMDLGTVKTRLDTSWYKSPRDFAEDVRLTFGNATTYNPKGQDVHAMAEQLSKIFEDKWASIEADYVRELRLAVDHEVSLPTPTSKRAPSQSLQAPETRRLLERSESMTQPIDPKLKQSNIGRTAAPKKPKAKEPNKREMTYDEKQKLSSNLQNLPSEKLENVVQIIKKRNPSLSQHDDEIEVDIDSVDTETLWELDRFVTNYKKSLSKNKRKAELANQARVDTVQTVQEKNLSSVAVEAQKDSKKEEKKIPSPPSHVERQQNNAGRSSSSSSSSTDSGSSSSDSESESTSGYGSDAGHSHRS